MLISSFTSDLIEAGCDEVITRGEFERRLATDFSTP